MPHGTSPIDIEEVKYQPSSGSTRDLEVFSMSDLRRRVSRAHLERHHRYDFHMFVHVRRGKCRAVVDFSHIECGAGSLLTIRPGQVHRFGPGSRWDANILLFRPQLLRASQDEERLQMPELIDALPGHLRLDRSTGRFLADTLARLEGECALDARQPLLNWLLQSELATLVTRLHIFNAVQQPSAGTSSDAPERFRLFKRLLDEKVHQWHHVSRYAQAMGCSEKTLTRICSAAVGVGAKAFIASRLALEAKRLLVHTEMPISAIAQRLGFDEATNFTKFFRSIEGCTPGGFRRQFAISS
ncbi:helix-turn-helix transcriptional regulator [Pelomonas aquatica]|nr:helix-turn-helix transcriptional regulator [Pelomonas aquatica]